MIATTLLLVLLVVAALTDIAWHRIFNWTTYPGIVAGLAARYFDGGWPGLEDGVKGFLLCGILMLFCFLLFDVGGGDLKLIAMMGACLGVDRGIEAMLWTFILGGVMGVSLLIWRSGVVHLFQKVVQHFRLVVMSKGWVPLTEQERAPLKRWLFLAPSALGATLIVLGDHQWGWFSRG